MFGRELHDHSPTSYVVTGSIISSPNRLKTQQKDRPAEVAPKAIGLPVDRLNGIFTWSLSPASNVDKMLGDSRIETAMGFAMNRDGRAMRHR